MRTKRYSADKWLQPKDESDSRWLRWYWANKSNRLFAQEPNNFAARRDECRNTHEEQIT